MEILFNGRVSFSIRGLNAPIGIHRGPIGAVSGKLSNSLLDKFDSVFRPFLIRSSEGQNTH
jgi:hypothetical protein